MIKYKYDIPTNPFADIRIVIFLDTGLQSLGVQHLSGVCREQGFNDLEQAIALELGIDQSELKEVK